MFLSVFLTAITLVTTCSGECSRELLKSVTNQYVSTQASGQSSNFLALSDAVNYTENEKSVNIRTSSILLQPLKIDHSRSIHDTTSCFTFTELIAATNQHPYVIGTRMLLTNNRVTTIESIVTDKGDWAFNATGYLYWNSLETWDPIPAEKRDTRATIQAAGDAYFDRFNNVSVVVPFGPLCARLEGGAYTGNGRLDQNSCDIGGLPSNIVVTNRRYVIDEEMGVVDIYLGFPGLDRSQGQAPMPDSHAFRVEDGKIRYIHTVSSCVTDGCGMNGTAPSLRAMRMRKRFSF